MIKGNAKSFDTQRCYKANEEIGLRFYQLPKALFNNPMYRGLSLGAKAMYSILRDRQELSIFNNIKNEDKWIDEEGNIYLLFANEPKKGDDRTIEDKPIRDLALTEILNISKNTVTKYKNELINYDLIFIKKMGQGKVDRIYVLKPELPPINVENYETPKNQDSKIPNNVNLESPKLTGSDTYLSDTDVTDTQSLNQEENLPIIQNKDGQTEYDNIKVHFQDMLKLNDLKISHPTNKGLIDEIELNIFEMYQNDYVFVNGKKQPQEVVRDALKRLTYWHINAVIIKYLEVSTEVKIKSPKAYIQTMLYNIIFQNELAITNELKYIGAI